MLLGVGPNNSDIRSATLQVTPPSLAVLGSGCYIDVQAWIGSQIIGGIRKLDIAMDTPLNGQHWSLARIIDNGPGLAEEHLPHIFNRFYRLDEARARAEDEQISGSGLGLAIASSIANAYGGKIEVESQVGVGTTFTIWLPMA